jgi:hypothetical protein
MAGQQKKSQSISVEDHIRDTPDRNIRHRIVLSRRYRWDALKEIDPSCVKFNYIVDKKTHRYIDMYKRGSDFPPVMIVRHGLRGVSIFDGNHRLMAASILGVKIRAFWGYKKDCYS